MKKKELVNKEVEYKMLNIEDTKYKTIITKKFENRKVWQK